MKHHHVLFAVWLALLTPALCAGATTFIEAGGVVDIEAEDWSNNVARVISSQTYQWIATNAVAGFSGTGYAEAAPNNGANQSTSWLTTSPQLDYAVNFNVAGTHYVWIRGHGESANDDSVHAGLNGTTNTAAAMTLTQTGAWQWSTNRTGFTTRGTISASTGTQTFHLWMREDGMRVDRVILTTNANFTATVGNSWHNPASPESGVGLTSMRVPVAGMLSNTAVAIYNGNQFQNGANDGDQAGSSSRILYKHATNATWSSLPMSFFGQSGNFKYFSNSIPANVFKAGDTVQYYLRIGYTDRLPTYLYGNDTGSSATEFETVAQANPFAYTVQWPLQPSGAFIAITNTATGAEARIYTNSGHLALGDVATFAPPAVKVAGNSYNIGRVIASIAITGGLELRQALGATSVVARLTFPHDGVMRYEVVDWGGLTPTEASVTGASDANEHFYGFGQKFNEFDQAGKKTRIITDDHATDKGDSSYMVAPWFVSTRGYGFHLDSSAESYFDMRALYSDRYVVSNLFSTLKFNVVYGPKLTDVLTRYTSYTGRPPLSPPWAFAPWMSSDIWRNGGEVRYVVTKYREHGLPGSVFVYDSPWEVAYNDFTWNTTQFGNGGTFEGQFHAGFGSVGDMMTFLRTNGWKAVVWMTPFLNTSSDDEGVAGANLGQAANYAAAAASNFLVKAVAGNSTNNLSVYWWKCPPGVDCGSPIDFTSAGARAWVAGQLSNLITQSASGGYPVISGFKTDDGESGNPPGSYIPTNALYADGRTGIEMQNAYSYEYHKAIWNVLGTNGLVFARSGFTGSHAFPGFWSGDNSPNFGDENGLRSVIVAGQSAAMSGYSLWSHDIGGYLVTLNPSSTITNLFMRWTQFGALTPIMQMHRQISTAQQYPWSFGAAALTNYQFYAKLHTALFPYLYSYAKETSTNGLPILRPLVLMYPTDSNTFAIKHTYLFGNELLVAPVTTNNATTRIVYLPAGNWYDFFTQQRHTGGQNVTWSSTDQSQMPLFARDGAILPMISTNVQTLCDSNYVANPNIITPGNSLEFLVYPTTNSSFTVYDGTSLSCQSNATVVTATLTSDARPILLRFLAGEPAGVERNGVRLPKYTSLDSVDIGWRYNAGFVEVKFPHGGGTVPVRFGPDSIGDGIPDSWRQAFFGTGATTNGSSCATCDADGDGKTNLDEYLAGSNPGSAGSKLALSNISATPAGTVTVTWNSDQNAGPATLLYDVYRTDGPFGNASAWTRIASNVPAAGASTFLGDNASAITQRFYRVTMAGHTNDVATSEIAGLHRLTLREGGNYVSMSMLPVTNTLLSILGTNQLPAGATESAATAVDVWDQSGQAFTNTTRYWLDTGTNGWKQSNTAAPANGALLDPDKGFIVTIRAGPGTQTLRVTGLVPTNSQVQVVQNNGYTVAGSLFPRTVSLDALTNGFGGGTSLVNSDNLVFFDSVTQQFDVKLWYDAAGGVWRNADASVATRQLEPGEAFLIRRRNRATDMIWTNPVPYSVPLPGP